MSNWRIYLMKFQFFTGALDGDLETGEMPRNREYYHERLRKI
jgi:hypothetical protein